MDLKLLARPFTDFFVDILSPRTCMREEEEVDGKTHLRANTERPLLAGEIIADSRRWAGE